MLFRSVVGQVVISRMENGVRVTETTLQTDVEGLTEAISLDAPPKSLSMSPGSTERPYAVYDVDVTADGYASAHFEGVQIYSGVEAYLPVNMIPTTAQTEDGVDPNVAGLADQESTRTVIPPPAIEGASSSGPAPLATCSTVPQVLDSVFIPRYITVHLGRPQNSAANETVSFPYYIKNVCSSEVYPTWVG